MGALMTALLLAGLDQTVVSVALPTMVGDLDGMDGFAWVVTAYLLGSTATTPLWGKLGDLHGRKRLFQAAIVIFVLGSALAGASQSMTQLITTRAIQGVGGGGLICLAWAVVADVAAPADRAKYQSYVGAVFGISSVCGPLVGGLLTEHLSWRWIFFVNVPLGALAMAATAVALRDPATRIKHRLDYTGAVLLLAGVCLLLVGLEQGPAVGWSSSRTLVELLVAGALLVTFSWWQTRAAEPILPMRLFRRRAISLSAAASFLTAVAMIGVGVYLPIYLQMVKGASPTVAGLQMLPMAAGMQAAAIATGAIVARTGRPRLYPIAGLATMMVAAVFLTQMRPGSAYVAVAVTMFFFGAGLGMAKQFLMLASQNAAEPGDLGVVTASVSFFRALGATVGAAVLGSLLSLVMMAQIRSAPAARAGTGHDASDLAAPQTLEALPGPARSVVVEAYMSGVHAVFYVTALVLVGALALALLLPDPSDAVLDGEPEVAAKR